MSRKAVINIRTSSESQGEKSSPNEQEADYRRLAVEKGLTLVRVYRDIEKYRAKDCFARTSSILCKTTKMHKKLSKEFVCKNRTPRPEKSGSAA